MSPDPAMRPPAADPKGANHMNDDLAVRLLEELRADPPGPPALDVPRMMAEGRRRRRLRRWSGGVAVAAVTAVAAGGGTMAVSALRDGPDPAPTTPPPTTVAAAPPAVPTGCKVTLLPTGGVGKALVTGGDPSGRYLAGRVYPDGAGVRTVLWKDGRPAPGATIPGSDASFDDITTAGVAVGTGFDGRGRQQAYVYRDGAVTRLRGGEAGAAAINEAGVIVGSVGEIYSGRPARWSSAGAAPTRLAMPAGFDVGEARGIAEDGTIVGVVGRRAMESTGHLWSPDGTGLLLPLPTVSGRKATAFWPESITDGRIVGRAVFDAADGGTRTFASMRYRIADGRYERLPVTLGPPAIGAANGWVLATTGRSEPVIVAGSRVVKLPRYAGLREYEVSSFSADGKVAGGYTTDSSGEVGVDNRPLMWTCR